MRDLSLYISDILRAIDLIGEFVTGMDFNTFSADEKTKSAVVMQLHIMGEAAKHVPEELRQSYPDVPWKQLAGMRDRLSHGYFEIDYAIVWQVVESDLPELRPTIQSILTDMK